MGTFGRGGGGGGGDDREERILKNSGVVVSPVGWIIASTVLAGERAAGNLCALGKAKGSGCVGGGTCVLGGIWGS